MIKEIICIGTSYTEGGGLYSPEVKDYYKKNNIVYDKQSEVAWPAHLGKLVNKKIRNLGKCGTGIDYLIRNVEEIIEHESTSDKLFILEYSGWGRTELWDSNIDKYIVTNWGPRDGKDPKTEGYEVMMTTDYTYGEQLNHDRFKLWETFLDTYFNEMDTLINRDKQFINLLYKLIAKNIKFLVIYLENCFWSGMYSDEVILANSLFMTRDDIPPRYDTSHGLSDFVGYRNERIIDILKETTDYHPNITGHKSIAEKINNYLHKKTIII